MTSRNASKGRKRHRFPARQCEYCAKPRKWFTQEWTYSQHARIFHDRSEEA